MNISPPVLFDYKSYLQKLRRAQKSGIEVFLLDRARDDLDDRLAGILRNFEAVADIGTPLSTFSQKFSQNTDSVEFLHIKPDVMAETMTIGLPLKPAHYSLILSAMALHIVNDLPGAMIQIRRALRPDGLFMACMPGGKTLHELRDVLQVAEIEVTGGISPRVLPFADIRDFGQLLQRAGFTLPVVDSETVTVRYADILALMRDLRAMAATNILNGRLKHATRRAVLQRAAELYKERFCDADGRIRATFEFIWVSGWAAHESQQKPLKPGSAKQKLTDALAAIASKK